MSVPRSPYSSPRRRELGRIQCTCENCDKQFYRDGRKLLPRRRIFCNVECQREWIKERGFHGQSKFVSSGHLVQTD
jgi:hypothetical protein